MILKIQSSNIFKFPKTCINWALGNMLCANLPSSRTWSYRIYWTSQKHKQKERKKVEKKVGKKSARMLRLLHRSTQLSFGRIKIAQNGNFWTFTYKILHFLSKMLVHVQLQKSIQIANFNFKIYKQTRGKSIQANG